MKEKKKVSRWYVIAFIITNLVAFFIIGFQEQQSICDILIKQAQRYEDNVNDVMNNYIHSFKLFSQMLTQQIENHPDTKKIWSYLKSIDKELLEIEGETYDGLYMYYQDHYLYSWDTPYSEYEKTGFIATERPWYKNAVAKKGEIVFTPPYMSYANHYILSTISQLQPEGETVFAYDIKMGDIQNIVSSLKSDNQEQVMIFDKSGTIIGSSYESYLGGQLNESLEETKETIEKLKNELTHNSQLTSTQKEKLQKQISSMNDFYQFKEGFINDYTSLSEKSTVQRITIDHTQYYGYILSGEQYDHLILIPLSSLLINTVEVWLIPLLILEFLLIYIFNRLSKEARNKELKAAYIELGQTQKRLEIALSVAQKAAAIDELTGMMNAKSFRKAVDEQIKDFDEDECGILIMIDGDHFKQINDTYGHLIGDEVIKLTAQMIIGRIRVIDHASRLHGDEFAIFISNTHDYEVAHRIMNDINDSIAKESAKRNMPSITISSGAVIAKKGNHYLELAKKADEALYQAKKSHNGDFCHPDK